MTRLTQLSRQERSPTWIEATDYIPSSDASWRGDELDSDTLRNIAIIVINQNFSPSMVRTGNAPSFTACDSFSRLSHLVTGLVEQGWAGKLAHHLKNKSDHYHFDFDALNAPLRVQHWPSNQLVAWDKLQAGNHISLFYAPEVTAPLRTRWLELAEISPIELTFTQMEELIDLLSSDLHDRKFTEISDNLEISDVTRMSADAVVAITRMISTESPNIRDWDKFIRRVAAEMSQRGEDDEIMAGLL